jgi:hypothetical protein
VVPDVPSSADVAPSLLPVVPSVPSEFVVTPSVESVLLLPLLLLHAQSNNDAIASVVYKTFFIIHSSFDLIHSVELSFREVLRPSFAITCTVSASKVEWCEYAVCD